MTARRSVPILALVFSLVLHAAALAALLVDWKTEPVEEPALSVELVIVSAPLDAPSDQPDPTPAPEPEPAASAPPPPPSVEPAPEPPAPKAPEPPKIVAKPEIAKPAPSKPQPLPRLVQPPINLDPGSGSDGTQQAKAPLGGGPSQPSFSLLHGPIPPYPPAARSRGQEGRVVLDVAIGIDGRPSDVRVGRSSGVDLLDESAVTTVKTWRFRNDSGQVLTVTVPIVFELRATAGR